MMSVQSSLRVLAALAIVLLAGCATLPPDLPPVPVGPAPSRSVPATTAPAPRAPSRAAGVPSSPRMESIPIRSAPSPAPTPPVVTVPAPLPHTPLPVVQTSVVEGAQAAPLEDEVLRLQVLLDRANFSPGCLDGRWGSQTRSALVAWQQREGMVASGGVDDALRAHLAAMQDVFVEHSVTAEEHAALRPRLSGWSEKAASDRLGFATILEAVAERYHSTERAMREWNPNAAWPNPPVGTLLRVPNVRVTERLYAARVEIHLATKYLQVFDGAGQVVAYFPCSIARQVEKRPVGELHIANAAENPNYTFDPELFSDDPAAAGIGRRLIIPPGPNNPVGVAWLSLDRPGYGIHGTPEPEKIGKTESHGCFRLANWNARKLLGMISIGTPVFVYE